MLVEWLAKIRHPSSSWRTSMICLCHHFGISSQDPHDCTISSCQGSRDWPRWFERWTLAFLGRSIFRRPGSSALYMQVDPTYLDEAFAEFDLKKGSTTFPDLRPILEQEGSQPLSAEGTCTFSQSSRSFVMYCQTRQDLLILVSMLGTGQAQRFETHEKCCVLYSGILCLTWMLHCVFHQKSLLCPM